MEQRELLEIKNPIAAGAFEIRTAAAGLAEGLGDSFPVDGGYMRSSYNLVFYTMKMHGPDRVFPGPADMIAMYPNGDIKSGRVDRYVGSFSNNWEFDKAEMEPATDLEVVKYGPQLISELFDKVCLEVPQQKDPNKTQTMLNFLSAQIEVLDRAQLISFAALLEMNGGDAELPSVVTEIKPMDTEKIRRFTRAFELYKSRDEIVNEITEIASNFRVGPLNERIGELVSAIAADELFPESDSFYFDGKQWFPAPDSLRAAALNSSHGEHFRWIVSKDGYMREAKVHGTLITQTCAEHQLTDVNRIIPSLINECIGEVLPGLRR